MKKRLYVSCGIIACVIACVTMKQLVTNSENELKSEKRTPLEHPASNNKNHLRHENRDGDGVEKIDALKSEIEDLRLALKASKESSDLQSEIYRVMIEQAQRELLKNPLDMSWDDFYTVSGSMKVREGVLLNNIISRLQRDLVFSDTVARKLMRTIGIERREIQKRFNQEYPKETLENFTVKLSEIEKNAIMERLKEIRSTVRQRFDHQYAELFPDDTQREVVLLHVRNDVSVFYVSNGSTGGGIGFPQESLGVLKVRQDHMKQDENN